jgi:CRISPR-associated endonuclease/helicase Cas3
MNSDGMDQRDFEGFFRVATGLEPYDWQVRLARGGLPEVLSVPTGLGKTAGVVLAWAWQRMHRPVGDVARHLVYCLPMRVLVGQTRDAILRWLAKVDLLSGQLTETGDGIPYEARFDQKGRIGVAVLYGGGLGEIEERWAEHPETQWILVGTQDQLLSRALNRGYAMNPYRWPVHFGLLNNDCHWVLDETQLMGPGLWTSAQLDWMRRLRFGAFGPSGTTWMSATLGTGFLATADRRREGLGAPRSCEQLDAAERRGLVDAWRRRGTRPSAGRLTAAEHAGRRLSAVRRVELFKPSKKGGSPEAQLGRAILDAHLPGTLSLVVCNTVEAAQKLYNTLGRQAPRVLLTSRFRAGDRLTAERRLLAFEARRAEQAADPPRVPDGPGLICVSTQIVEAGLDVSARRLWSEVAPWPSLVQRLGRCNRDGREVDAAATFWMPERSGRPEGNLVGPYERAKVDRALELVRDLVPRSNVPTAEALDEIHGGRDVSKTLEPDPAPLPRAKDIHELFSTEQDVHGGYTDVAQFVRGLDEDVDALVFWRRWDPKRSPNGDLDGPAFDPAEACPVATFALRRLLDRRAGWVWDAQRARWEEVRPDGVRPGMVLMLPASYGGYSQELGWTGQPADVLGDLPGAGPGSGDLLEEARSESGAWVRLDVHLGDAEREARDLAHALELDQPHVEAVACAAALHDLGKAHPHWQRALPEPRPPGIWAKSPFVLRLEGTNRAVAKACAALPRSAVIVVRDLVAAALPADRVAMEALLRRKLTRGELGELRSIAGLVRASHRRFRPGLRHEAATALALWSRYWSGSKTWPLLSTYLAAAHHGKVRAVLRSLSSGDDVFGVPCDSAPLVVGDESWSLDFRCAADGTDGHWEGSRFLPASPGWTAVVADLLGASRGGGSRPAGTVPEDEPGALGPFRLAYLEALVRVADWRASDRPSAWGETSP